MDVNNFAAFAIVLQKPIADALGTAYEALVKRYESENKNIRYVCLKNNEVIYMQCNEIVVQSGKTNLIYLFAH